MGRNAAHKNVLSHHAGFLLAFEPVVNSYLQAFILNEPQLRCWFQTIYVTPVSLNSSAWEKKTST